MTSKHLKASFRHAVGNQARLGLASLDAADVYDAALADDQHVLEEVNEDVGRSDVDIHQVVMILREDGFEVSCKYDSCCVHEDVQAGLIVTEVRALGERFQAVSGPFHVILLDEFVLDRFN
eukprot:CAMPEP_0170489268 /NCGR_PEP_ID=MMETSP0208-20121228/7639_1 /TAXON_ID=197538 /ORGANISM="Strombidium inclinatum, Strain S3" /LENGTH=120 /DNA_ID=CAMNT_0010764113 /DNA_START=472 /DNA_END=835 /DNA_ORIENTATION=-